MASRKPFCEMFTWARPGSGAMWTSQFVCVSGEPRATSHESAWFRVPERRNNATMPACLAAPPVPVHRPPFAEGGPGNGGGRRWRQRTRRREQDLDLRQHQKTGSLVKLCDFPIECDDMAKRKAHPGNRKKNRGVDIHHGFTVFLDEMMPARMGGGQQTATPSRSQDDDTSVWDR